MQSSRIRFPDRRGSRRHGVGCELPRHDFGPRMWRGGATHCIMRFWREKRTTECALQTHSWLPSRVGWSGQCPLPLSDIRRRRQTGRKDILAGRIQIRFWGGVLWELQGIAQKVFAIEAEKRQLWNGSRATKMILWGWPVLWYVFARHPRVFKSTFPFSDGSQAFRITEDYGGWVRGEPSQPQLPQPPKPPKPSKPPRLPHGAVFCRTRNRRARCSAEPPKPSKPSWRLPPLNPTPLFRHPEVFGSEDYELGGFKKLHCSTPEKWFGGKFSVRWFGFRPKCQSHRRNVGVTDHKSELQPGRPPESEPNCPEMEHWMGMRCFQRKLPWNLLEAWMFFAVLLRTFSWGPFWAWFPNRALSYRRCREWQSRALMILKKFMHPLKYKLAGNCQHHPKNGPIHISPATGL